MKSLIYFLSAITLFACSDDDQNSSTSCSDQLVCTEEFRTIIVEIANSENEPITLDFTRVTNVPINEELGVSNWLGLLSPGSHIVTDDGQFDNVEKEGTLFQFEGFIGGERAVNQEFLIGHDCCHVILLEGPEKIVIP